MLFGINPRESQARDLHITALRLAALAQLFTDELESPVGILRP